MTGLWLGQFHIVTDPTTTFGSFLDGEDTRGYFLADFSEESSRAFHGANSDACVAGTLTTQTGSSSVKSNANILQINGVRATTQILQYTQMQGTPTNPSTGGVLFVIPGIDFNTANVTGSFNGQTVTFPATTYTSNTALKRTTHVEQLTLTAVDNNIQYTADCQALLK